MLNRRIIYHFLIAVVFTTQPHKSECQAISIDTHLYVGKYQEDSILTIFILKNQDSIYAKRLVNAKFEYSSSIVHGTDTTCSLVIETQNYIYNISVFKYCFDYKVWNLFFPRKVHTSKIYNYINCYNGGYCYTGLIKCIGKFNKKKILVQI